jgi:pimeloyl-ACP methyl ester carboxylesterase
MARLERPDGVEIAWEEMGDGPLVVLAAYWSGHPRVYAALLDELARDHRVVTYDARGTGASTRVGPYDMKTDAADLAAVIDAGGSGPAVVIAIANGTNYAVRVAAERPELVAAVFASGTAPFALSDFEGGEGMVGSASVIDAFLEMLERDYRGAMRTLLTATNPQMDEAELRARVGFQVDYCSQEAVTGRVRAWVDEDPGDAARATGERLIVLSSPDVAGPWLPPEAERLRLAAELLPEARIRQLEDGAVSRPDLTAAAVRSVTAPLRVGAR